MKDDLERLDLLKQINTRADRHTGARMLAEVNQHKEGTQLRADAEVAYTEFMQQQHIERDNLDKEFSAKEIERDKNKDDSEALAKQLAEMKANMKSKCIECTISL